MRHVLEVCRSARLDLLVVPTFGIVPGDAIVIAIGTKFIALYWGNALCSARLPTLLQVPLVNLPTGVFWHVGTGTRQAPRHLPCSRNIDWD